MSDKQNVFYGGDNPSPNQQGVTYVAIAVDVEQPFVWATYFYRDRQVIPESVRDSSNMRVMSIAEAKKQFEFRPREHIQ